MPTLRFEHAIKDFEMWKAAFDRDPIDRCGLGVTRHRIHRPIDDASYVLGELEFDTLAEARAAGDALGKLWKSSIAAPALAGAPQVRILETIEDEGYDPG